MDEARAGNDLEAAEGELLLDIEIVVQALAVGLRSVVDIADESIFVFDAVSKGGVRPSALRIITLIFESGAIDVVDFVRRKVELAVERAVAGGITVEVEFVVAIEIIEGGEAVLPAFRRGDA